MSPTTEALLQAALALPEQERRELVDALLDSQGPSSELEFYPEWLREMDRRSAEFKAGGAERSTWEEAVEEVWRRLEGRTSG